MIEMTIDSIRVSLMNYQRVVILEEKGTEEAVKRYLPIWIGPAEADAIAVKLQNVNVPRPLTHDLLRSVIDALGATINSIIISDLKNDTFYAKINLALDGGQLISKVEEEIEKRLEARVEQEYKWVSFLWGDARYRLQVLREWQEPGKRFLEGLKQDDNCVFELCYDEKERVWFITKRQVDSRPSDALALAVRADVPIYAEEVVLDKAAIILDKETGKPIPPESGEAGDKKVSDQELRRMSAFRDFIDTLDLDDFDKRKS